jgi:rod shape-determining protein MreD
LVTAATLVVAAVVQSTALPHLAVLGVKVDLVLLLIVAWSIRRGVEEGLVWVLIGGLAVDVLSAEPFGASIVAFGLACIVAGSAGPALRKASALLPLALTPLASVVATLAAAFVLAALGWPISWPATVALVVLPAAVLDSLAMLIVYPVISAVDQRLATVEWPG